MDKHPKATRMFKQKKKSKTLEIINRDVLDFHMLTDNLIVQKLRICAA